MIKSNSSPISRGWFRDSWLLTKPFWTGPEKYQAIFLLTATIIFNLAQVGMAVYSNRWNGKLYDAIQNYAKEEFFTIFVQIFFLIIISVIVTVTHYYLNSLLQIRWRKWLTAFYLENWLKNKAYYKIKFGSSYVDNPDQRISEDINQFISLTAGLFFGILSSVTTIFSFSIILWNLSSHFKFHLYGYEFEIPGYMLWITIIYTLVATYTTFKIGRPLVKLDYQQQMYEADFRYNLVRIREYAENIASYKGDEIEKKIAGKNFDNIVTNY